MQKLRLLFVLAFLASGLLSCKFLNRLQSSKPKYGILNEKYGAKVLRNLNNSGKIELCLSLSGAPKVTEAEGQKVLNVFTNALNEWNRVFHELDPTFWTHKKIGVIHLREPDCEALKDGPFSESTGNPRLNLVVLAKKPRADINLFTAIVEFEFSELMREPGIALHEIGHLFGLSDIYQEDPTISGPLEGQPRDALMNNHYLNAITEDERAGIWTLFSFLKTDELICASGYRPYIYPVYIPFILPVSDHKIAPGSEGSLFCILSADFIRLSTEDFWTLNIRNSYSIVTMPEAREEGLYNGVLYHGVLQMFRKRSLNEYIECRNVQGTEIVTEVHFEYPNEEDISGLEGTIRRFNSTAVEEVKFGKFSWNYNRHSPEKILFVDAKPFHFLFDLRRFRRLNPDGSYIVNADGRSKVSITKEFLLTISHQSNVKPWRMSDLVCIFKPKIQ